MTVGAFIIELESEGKVEFAEMTKPLYCKK